MKYRYSRYVADVASEIDLESLVSRLSDLLLASGFNTPWDPQSDDDRTMQALHDAILDALLNGGMLSDEMLERLMDGQANESDERDPTGQRGRDQLEELVQQIIERLTEQGYITMAGQPARQRFDDPNGQDESNSRFEVTDKALDFLGYRALRDLLGSAGRSSAGRHDTRELDSGIEAGGPPRQYLFGDTMNLDAAATVLSAVQRQSSARGPREDSVCSLERERRGWGPASTE